MSVSQIYLRLLIVGFVWGSAFNFIKIVLTGVGPITLVAGRTAMGAAAVLLFLLAARKASLLKLPWSDLKNTIILGIINTALPFMLITWGQKTVPSGIASVMNSMTPVFTVIFAVIFLKESLPPRRIFGIILGFVGIILLTHISSVGFSEERILPYFAIVLAAVCYGGSAIFAKKFLNEVDVFAITFYNLAVAAVITFAAAMLFEKPFDPAMSLGIYGAWVYLAFFSSFIGFTLYYSVLKDSGPVTASTVTYLVPMFALLIGLLFLEETLTGYDIAGMVCILAGVVAARK